METKGCLTQVWQSFSVSFLGLETTFSVNLWEETVINSNYQKKQEKNLDSAEDREVLRLKFILMGITGPGTSFVRWAYKLRVQIII